MGCSCSRKYNQMTHLDVTAPTSAPGASVRPEAPRSSYITANDGTQIYYKDWGAGPSVVFSHEARNIS